ncbi:hypothetical protein AAHE18_U064500 [Arachis hypogaea]
MSPLALSINEFSNQPINWQRLLLKISGEALVGDHSQNIDPKINNLKSHFYALFKSIINRSIKISMAIAREVAAVTRLGIEMTIMLATIMNALFLQATMESIGILTQVQIVFCMSKVAELYIHKRSVRHLKKGRVIIFAVGIGNPFFTTDTVVALRSVKINEEVVLKAKIVDGVHVDDPRRNPQARVLDTLSYQEVTLKDLSVMDMPSITLCQKNNILVVVFNLNKPGNIEKAIKDEMVGTLIWAT